MEKHPIENALSRWSIFFFHVICTIVPKCCLKLFFNAMGVQQVEPVETTSIKEVYLGKLCSNDVLNVLATEK